MAKQKDLPKDVVSWLLRVPVLLIWMDAEKKIARWQISSMADAMLLLSTENGG